MSLIRAILLFCLVALTFAEEETTSSRPGPSTGSFGGLFGGFGEEQHRFGDEQRQSGSSSGPVFRRDTASSPDTVQTSTGRPIFSRAVTGGPTDRPHPLFNKGNNGPTTGRPLGK